MLGITQRNATHRNSTYFRCRAYKCTEKVLCHTCNMTPALRLYLYSTPSYPDGLASDMIATA